MHNNQYGFSGKLTAGILQSAYSAMNTANITNVRFLPKIKKNILIDPNQ